MATGSYTFVIVAQGDTPVYGAEFLAAAKKDGQDTSHLNQLIIHAALDMVDDAVWTSNNMCAAARGRRRARRRARSARAGHHGARPRACVRSRALVGRAPRAAGI